MKVFEWHKRSQGREKIEEYEILGTLATARPVGKEQKVIVILRIDRLLSIQMISDMVNIKKEIEGQILRNELGKTKVFIKMDLTQQQKSNWRKICSDIVEQLTQELEMLTNVITFNEI